MALLAKLGWRMLTCPNDAWCKVFRSKYGVEDEDGAYFKHRQCCSHIWRGVVCGSDLHQKGLRCEPLNGSSIHFWKDAWLVQQPLCESLQLESEFEGFNRKVLVLGTWPWVGMERAESGVELFKFTVASLYSHQPIVGCQG